MPDLTLVLSRMALAIIDMKAAELNVSREEIVEHMVMEFRPSTMEDVHNQQDQRKRDREAFLLLEPNASIARAWTAGHTAGWGNYQNRKPDGWAAFWRRRKRA